MKRKYCPACRNSVSTVVDPDRIVCARVWCEEALKMKEEESLSWVQVMTFMPPAPCVVCTQPSQEQKKGTGYKKTCGSQECANYIRRHSGRMAASLPQVRPRVGYQKTHTRARKSPAPLDGTKNMLRGK